MGIFLNFLPQQQQKKNVLKYIGNVFSRRYLITPSTVSAQLLLKQVHSRVLSGSSRNIKKNAQNSIYFLIVDYDRFCVLTFFWWSLEFSVVMCAILKEIFNYFKLKKMDIKLKSMFYYF